MGLAVEGPTGVGKVPNRPPVLAGGVDANGNVQVLSVAADGTIKTVVAP